MTVFIPRSLFANMEISEDKIRQIVQEAQRELGPKADPVLLRKIVRDVIRELEREDAASRRSDSSPEMK